MDRQFGHYRLAELLGVGGMGEVYRAHDDRRGRWVALKLLPESLSGDRDYLDRFRREQHVAARLREPHVIPIHDFGEIDGRLFIDMRLVDGADLSSILTATGPLPAARAVGFVAQVAEALMAAHADGLVHRDVKPSNVLVTARDFAYVVDFGIARSVGMTRTSLTMTGATVGTLDYMAPERFTNLPIDGRADIYSLSCLLHECLTATRPFRGEDLPSLMYAHLYTAAPRPSTLAPDVPPALDAVVERGMAKDREDRFATPRDLADAAVAALGTVSRAAPETPPAPGVTVRHVDPIVIAEPRPTSSGTARAGTGPAGAQPMPVGALGLASADGSHRSAEQLPRPRELQDGPPADRPTVGDGGPPYPAGQYQPLGSPGGPGGPPLGTASFAVPARRRGRLALVLAALLLVAAGTVGVVLQRSGTDRSQAAGAVSTMTDDLEVGSTLGAAEPESSTAAVTPPPAASRAIPTVGVQIPAGTTPGFVQVAPDGRLAYVANREAGVVTVIDTAIDQVTATIPIPQGPPQFLSFSRDGSRGYVSVYNADRTVNEIVVVDTATNRVMGEVPVGRRPFASATNPDGSLLYVPSHDDSLIDVVDTATSTVARTIPVAPNPHWLVFSVDGRFIYTANHDSGLVTVLDAANDAVVTEIPVGESPHSIAVSPDGGFVSVVNYMGNTVSVIDTATNTVVHTVQVGQQPQDIDYAPDGRFFYTANVTDGTISVVDTETYLVTATVPTSTPTSIAVRPDGVEAYVTNLDAGTVTVLQLSGR